MTDSVQDKLLRHKIAVQRVGVSEGRRLKQNIRKAIKPLEDMIYKTKGTISPSEYNKALKEVQERLTQLNKRGSTGDMAKLARYEASFVTNTLNKSKDYKDIKKPSNKEITEAVLRSKVSVGVDSKKVTIDKMYRAAAVTAKNDLEKMVAEANRQAKRLLDKEDKEVQQELKKFNRRKKTTNKLVEGLSEKEILKRQLILEQIQESLRVNGKFERKSKYIGETITNHVTAAAQKEVYSKNADMIGRVIYVAILDDAVCENCEALDGQIWAAGQEEESVPLHMNCRCAILPYEESEESEDE